MSVICLLGICCCLTGGARSMPPAAGGPAGQTSEMAWLELKEPVSDEAFSPGQSPALNTGKRRASIYSWSMALSNDGAFFDLSRMLSDLGIGRVYQEITQVYLSRMETPVMVNNLAQLGVETVFLTGEREWGRGDLDEFYRQIDALCAYNKGIGASNPIKAVALDVEAYTLTAWNDDPETYFALFVEQMEKAYQYAHKQGFSVVQVIPAHLDTIDRELFERFVQNCCDEISVMNYQKDFELSQIWNEVLVCRKLGKPIETIFETMPLNKHYTVTEEKTYFYDGMEALKAAEKALLDLYGDSLGVSYHHYQTMYCLYTGAYMAEIYPYTSKSDRQRDKNGQPKVLESILLRGSDGSLQTAYPYNPNLDGTPSELCFLAVGVKEGVQYTVTMQSRAYGIDKGKDVLTFTPKEGNVVITEALHIHPLH